MCWWVGLALRYSGTDAYRLLSGNGKGPEVSKMEG